MRWVRSVGVLACVIVAACGGASKHDVRYDGEHATGLFALPDGGFLVALAEVFARPCGAANADRCDVHEDLYMEHYGTDGTLAWRAKILAEHAPFLRVMMKRLGAGQLLLSTSSDESVFFVSADGTKVDPRVVPTAALSRMKDGNDWLVGGVSERRLVRYRVADSGALTTELTIAAFTEDFAVASDVRATSDGGVAGVLTIGPVTQVVRYDNTGVQAFKAEAPDGTFGQLLNSTTPDVRVVWQHGSSTSIRTFDATGAVKDDLALASQLPSEIWPVDNGGIAAVDANTAQLLAADGSVAWTHAGTYGTAPQIFSNGMRTLIASHAGPSHAAGSYVTITDLDANGAATGTYPITMGQLRTIPEE